MGFLGPLDLGFRVSRFGFKLGHRLSNGPEFEEYHFLMAQLL